MKVRCLNLRWLLACSLCCLVLVGAAFTRLVYSDSEVAARAELIVIGRIKPDFLAFITHVSKEGATSHEYQVELWIDQVLKGKPSGTSMVVSISRGMSPRFGGSYSNYVSSADGRFLTNHSNGAIEFYDTCGSPDWGIPFTGDIRTNHIWLLHHEKRPKFLIHTGTMSVLAPEFPPLSDKIAVVDPCDIQPLAKKETLVKLMK